MSVAVVTDSTAYLPDGLAERRRVRVVPLHVMVDDRSGLDGVDVGPSELAAALSAGSRVSTSRPTPEELATAYHAALDSADGVVAVHLSRELSGTWEAAQLAAEQVGPDVVRVVDSRSTAMGLGFAVLAAARRAEDGVDLDGVYEAAVDVAGRCHTFFSLETLEHLRQGGRIGAAAALVGTALSMKPLLHVAEGRIVPLEKVRTTGRARARLEELVVQVAGDDAVDAAVHHLAAPERAAELAERLHARLPRLDECHVSEVGAAVGAHTGPGTLGAVVVPGGL